MKTLKELCSFIGVLSIALMFTFLLVVFFFPLDYRTKPPVAERGCK